MTLRSQLLVILALIVSFGVAAKETILVTGATGRQGGAVVNELLTRGYEVRAMTRSPEGDRAQALASRERVTVVRADFMDPESLRAAMEGVHGVFLYTVITPDELQHGKNAIAAAQAAGVNHVVYSSSAAVISGIAERNAKAEVERHLRDSGLAFSVLRPVMFMDNWNGQQSIIAERGIIDSRDASRKVQFIAVRDIAFLAGEAFDNPHVWLGRAENIAGDEITLAVLVETFSRVMGREITFTQMPIEDYLETEAPPRLKALYRWFYDVGYTVDMRRLQEEFPNLTTVEEFLRDTGWENWQPQGGSTN